MRHVHATSRAIGSRGAMLLTLALLWTWLFTIPLIRGTGATCNQFDVFYCSWPEGIRLAGWATTCAVAVVAAFVPPRKDWFGWVALTLMPAQRLFAWAGAWYGYARAGDEAAEDIAWYYTGLYLLIIVVIWVAAAMRPAALEAREIEQESDG